MFAIGVRDLRDELVRIDARGEVHPIGVAASQALRARTGTFRMLPSPPHVVLLRYTGEDGRRDAGDGAVVRLAGEITSPGAMCDVLAMLAQTGWRGELVVLDGGQSRSLYLEGGNVVGVRTNVEEERLGMVMYRFGAITQAQHEEIQQKVGEGQRFGASGVALGIFTQDKVYACIGKQVEEVVFKCLAVADGTFYFLDGFDASELVSRHSVSAGALLMEGVTRLDEMRYFRQKVPSSDHVPTPLEGRSPPAPEFVRTFQEVDGRRSVLEIGRITGKGEFSTTKDLYALVQSQHVSIQPPRPSGGPASLVKVANAGLQIILRAADGAERGTEVRESLASFAVMAGVYAILFQGAGPDGSGALDPARVAQNLALVASSPDPENELKQMLHEYVSFALFSAGDAIGPERERDLKRDVTHVLEALRPRA